MLLWSNTVLMLVFLFCFYHSWFEIINNNKVALMFGGFTRCIHIWLSAKRCANGGSDFWLSIKSVSNTLSCCCFVCAFIIGQYHSGNNMSSKSGAAGEILFFQSEKHKIFDPWKRTRSRWVLLMLSFMYMTNQNITSVTDLHRGDIALHSAYKIDYY